MPCCNCAFVAGTKGHHRKVLVIGGQFSGLFSASDLKKHFHVTIVDAKEFFEYTPGVLRCFVKPAHFDSLSFTLQPVIERSMGVKFIWGEVKELDGANKTATIKTMFSDNKDTISWDYCMICAGCNFGPFKPMGESLWFPTVHEEGRKVSDWAHIDERFHEGRRRHILEEYHKLHDYNSKSATVLIVGAGFIGVEWATELEHFFPNLKITIIDFLPNCLGPLPERAATYCSDYMHASGIKEFYGKKFAPDDQKFWDEIELPNKPDVQYVCIGVKASNYFMPKETLSEKGPGGGGWIHMNEFLQVTYKPTETRKCTVWKAGAVKCGKKTMDAKIGDVWADGCVFAVGDCNYGCIEGPGKPTEWPLPPIPKISYPGEEQALHACKNLDRVDAKKYGAHFPFGRRGNLKPTWWPWGAGMFATSLGPHDACFVLAANAEKGSGYMVNWWIFAALQKEIIETTKIDECRNRFLGKAIWHYVHHTPCNCWGKGPWIP